LLDSAAMADIEQEINVPFRHTETPGEFRLADPRRGKRDMEFGFGRGQRG